MDTKPQALICGMTGMTRMAVAGALYRLGFQLGCATGPWDAVEFAARTPLALLVIDLDGAGAEAAPALVGLRERARADVAPPTIVGIACDQRQARGTFVGMHLCLSAPFDLPSFSASVAGLVAKAGAGAPAGRPSHAPGSPTLDPTILARLRACGEAAVVEIFGTMRSELAKHDQCLLAAFAAGDALAVGRQAHTLKGASGSVGLLALSTCCAELERVGKAGDFATAQGLKPNYARHLAEAGTAIAELLAGLAQPAGGGRS